MPPTDPTMDAPPTTVRAPHRAWVIPDDRRMPTLEPYADEVRRSEPETVRTTFWDSADRVLEREGVELTDDAERASVEVFLRGRPVVPARIRDTTTTTTILAGHDGGPRVEVRDVTVDEGDPTAATLRSRRIWTVAGDDRPRGVLRAVERALTAEADGPGVDPATLPEPPVRSARVERPSGGRRTGRPRAAGFVVGALGATRAAIVDADLRVRADEHDAIHALRKAIRRTRSVLAVFRGALDPVRTDALDDALAAIGRIAGAARDAEVLHAGLLRSTVRAPEGAVDALAVERLDAHLGELWTATAADVRQTLDDASWFAALDDLDALRRDAPAGPHADDDPADFVARRIRHERHRLRGRVAHAGSHDLAALHGVRKAARRLRYGLEAAGDVADVGRRRLGVLQKAQDSLGDALDAANAASAYREVATLAFRDQEDTFGYGVLAAVEAAVSEARIARYRRLATKL